MQRAYLAKGSAGSDRVAPNAAWTQSSPLGQILPLVLLIYSVVLLPPEVQIRFAQVNLPFYRIFILAMVPLIIGRFSSGRTRVDVADWLLLLMAIWMIFSFVDVYGLRIGVVRGGGVAIDAAGAFLIARVSIDGTAALRRVLIAIAPALALAGLEMMMESLSNRLLVRPAFAAVFGNVAAYAEGRAVGSLDIVRAQDIRFGLLRAFGPFPHPILGGVILASMLPFWIMGGVRSWPRWLGIASGVLGLFSVSSAAFLALALGVGLWMLDWLRRFTTVRWPLITSGLLLVLLAVEMISSSGIVRLLARVSLDPQTAFYRILIWQYGTESVVEHPLYGIGYASYVRPSWMSPSIDAHFLALAVSNGLVVPVLLIIALVVTMIRLGQRSARLLHADRNLLVACNFTLFIAVVSALTVTFFGGANIWFMAMIGVAASLAVAPARMLPSVSATPLERGRRPSARSNHTGAV